MNKREKAIMIAVLAFIVFVIGLTLYIISQTNTIDNVDLLLEGEVKKYWENIKENSRLNLAGAIMMSVAPFIGILDIIYLFLNHNQDKS